MHEGWLVATFCIRPQIYWTFDTLYTYSDFVIGNSCYFPKRALSHKYFLIIQRLVVFREFYRITYFEI